MLTGFALSLFGASTAAARSEFYGITQGSLDKQDVQGMAANGVQTERFLLRWKSIEPSQGSFDWSSRDRFIGQLASQGIRPFPFVWGSPSWVGNGALAQPPLNSTSDQAAWRDFLTRAVARYGPGGTYWGTLYHQQYGASATPVPIQSWQIWNEPNLKKFFTPGENVDQSAHKYAQLLQISHDAIKVKDPKAQIVFAGMPGYGDSKAWVFLDHVYGVAGAESYFDVAALHPYTRDIDEFRREIVQFRASMTNHGDGRTPLWLTELAWGSGPPDQYGHNVGLSGQQQMLSNSFKLILNRRSDWNIQRVFWFLWRDPAPGSFYAKLCSICGTAGLLNYDRTPKPAYYTFKAFTTDSTAPVARFTSGPTGATGDSTPTFGFASNENGSTFQCHWTDQNFFPCSSPVTRTTPFSDGTHAFYVKAIDAVGNESTVISRQFVVDTVPPQTTITGGPAAGSSTADRTPTFTFSSSEANSTFQCRYEGDGFSACSGAGSDTVASPLPDGPNSFFVKAVDPAGNQSEVVSQSFTVDTVAPTVWITDADRTTTTRRSRRARETLILQASEHVGLRCRIDLRPFKSCSSPYRTPKLMPGTHRLKVKATDEAGNVGTKRKRFKIARNVSRRISSTAASAPSHPRCHGVAATLIGSPHGDVLRGTQGRDVIVGFAGNDKIDGRGGRDLICGRRGDDQVIAGRGDDRVLGGPGSDHIRGGAGRDLIWGGSGVDYCAGALRGLTFHCEDGS